jgi:hypothetical protein
MYAGDGDCSVTVNEVLAMVNIALGARSVSDCLAGDADSDTAIAVAEILTAVTYALDGCPVAVCATLAD